jgi:hypothetical protein
VRFRMGLMVGFGAGYVLGSRAGRERYEQIRQAAQSFWGSETVHRVRDQAMGTMQRVREQAGLNGNQPIDLTQDQREMIGAP